MIQTIAVMFRAWYPGGNSFSGPEFVAALQVDPAGAAVGGEGKRWETARIVFFELELAKFKGQPEPNEAFVASLNDGLQVATQFLSRVGEASVGAMRSSGLKLDVFINLWMALNQLDLILPPQFLKELSRLDLPLKIISND